jgi:hypothetical protein
MDDLSITAPLTSTTPVREVQSRHPSGERDQQHSARKRWANSQELAEDDETSQIDDIDHAVDEQA